MTDFTRKKGSFHLMAIILIIVSASALALFNRSPSKDNQHDIANGSLYPRFEPVANIFLPEPDWHGIRWSKSEKTAFLFDVYRTLNNEIVIRYVYEGYDKNFLILLKANSQDLLLFDIRDKEQNIIWSLRVSSNWHWDLSDCQVKARWSAWLPA